MIKDKNNPDLAEGQVIDDFTIDSITSLPVLRNTMYQLTHQTTGARLIHLSNEDDNNCFGVAFRTTPKDSTGVAHILEHTALCGSEKFPVRDPFFSMIRRSMKTFMNAFTASDWTMYPFSTQNETDYYNLMRVYLDAAFFPKLSDLSFKQEGHRLEFADPESPESPLTIQGVVYNEMKGAMSSQSQVMHDCTGKSLFPTTTYKYNSGGDPESIIHLTHEQLIEFHKCHYHPSNSYFFTYGNIPLEKTLRVIHKEALNTFSRIEVHTGVPEEERYTGPKTFSYSYPLTRKDDDGAKCQVALSWLTCSITDPLEVLSLQLINLILLGHAGAPMRKKLLESKLGKALADTTGFEDEIREPYFSIGLQGVKEKDISRVENLILSTLEEILSAGIQPKQIESAIHQIEFDTREISGGHYPYSLNLLFRFFGTWVHGGDPVLAIDFDNTLKTLKEKIKEGPFLEKQIRKYLLDNPHRVRVVLKPDWELEKERNERLNDYLASRKKELSEQDRKKLIEDARALKSLQEKKEDLSCLPTLQISDIPNDIRFVESYREGVENLDVTFYDRPTNGILYFNWYFRIDDLPEGDRIWLPLLGYLLTNTGAGDYSYEEMAEQISLYTGGFSANPVVENRLDKGGHSEYFTFSSKALDRNQERLFSLASLIIGERSFDETDRIQALILQRTNQLINSIVQIGHNYAASLATRNFCRSSYLDELYGGVRQVQFMKKLSTLSKSELKKNIHHLRSLLSRLLKKDNLSVLAIGDCRQFDSVGQHIIEFNHGLKPLKAVTQKQQPTIEDGAEHPSDIYPHEAWLTTTPVSYVVKAYKTIPYTHPDSPKLLVLSNLAKSCFLHGEIREKGGAYGAMTSYNTDEGVLSLLSYRDPNLARTLNVYDGAVEWLRSGSFSDREVEETILQTCSNIDTPLAPATKAISEFIMKRKGKTREMREAFRAGILSTTGEDIVRLANEQFNSDAAVAAVTNEETVKRDRDAIPEKPLQEHWI